MRIKFYRTAIIGINDKTTFLYQTLVELYKNKGLTLKKEPSLISRIHIKIYVASIESFIEYLFYNALTIINNVDAWTQIAKAFRFLANQNAIERVYIVSNGFITIDCFQYRLKLLCLLEQTLNHQSIQL